MPVSADHQTPRVTLDQILVSRREDVQRLSAAVSLTELKQRCRDLPPVRPFCQTLRNVAGACGLSVIAEFKRMSPSEGEIRPGAEPAEIARLYEQNGAACMSVLTEPDYFGGKLEDLAAARGAVSLPVLRKDFLIDPWQIYESRAAGADCILLIAEAVSAARLQELYGLACELGLDVLVELFEESSLAAVCGLDPEPPLVGINNRNLQTLKMYPGRTLEFRHRVPAGSWLVNESGFSTPEAIRQSVEAGVQSFLIGTGLMKAEDPGRKLRELLGTA